MKVVKEMQRPTRVPGWRSSAAVADVLKDTRYDQHIEFFKQYRRGMLNRAKDSALDGEKKFAEKIRQNIAAVEFLIVNMEATWRQAIASVGKMHDD